MIEPVDHVVGPMKAAIELIEYSDFECPLCAQAYHAIDILLQRFGHRIRFVFRHFPLVEIHPHAELAAEAAEAAGAQSKFWPMYRQLFENQQHLKAKDLRNYAADIGLDLERYDSEIADHIYLQRVQEHLASGRARGVRGSPALFLNGDVVDVSFGLQSLAEAVEHASSRDAATVNLRLDVAERDLDPAER
ncbi:MAG: DsbA family protein [Betaproteobacteria bacterium]